MLEKSVVQDYLSGCVEWCRIGIHEWIVRFAFECARPSGAFELPACALTPRTVVQMHDSQNPPYRRRPAHSNPLLRLLSEIESLCGVEGMMALDRGATFDDVQIDLVAHAIEDLGDYKNGDLLLRAWVEKYLADTVWLHHKWSDKCEAVLFINPSMTLRLLSGGWIHIELELEFERVSDLINLPLVHSAIGAHLPPPPDDPFGDLNDPDFPFVPGK